MSKLNCVSLAVKPYVMVSGNYGTGKTTVSAFLHRHLEGYQLFSMNRARAELGITEYRGEDTPRVMRHLDTQVRRALESGSGVIVYRPHQSYVSRIISYSVAEDYGHQALVIECVCPREIAIARIVQRPPTSNNNPENFRGMERNREDMASDFLNNLSLASFVSHIRYDTGDVPKAVLLKATETLRGFAEQVIKLLNDFRPQQ